MSVVNVLHSVCDTARPHSPPPVAQAPGSLGAGVAGGDPFHDTTSGSHPVAIAARMVFHACSGMRWCPGRPYARALVAAVEIASAEREAATNFGKVLMGLSP